MSPSTRPPGVGIVCATTAVVGLLWTYAGVFAIPPDPLILFGPLIGFCLFGVAWGLYDLRPLAWRGAVVTYGVGAAWWTVRTVTADVGNVLGAILALVAVGYLFLVRDSFGVAPADDVSTDLRRARG